MGSDSCEIAPTSAAVYFYPRSPRGERQGHEPPPMNRRLFLSTLPAWGATRTSWKQWTHTRISIHAPRVGSDRCKQAEIHKTTISIHAPRVGSDHSFADSAMRHFVFLSTLPAWGATGKLAANSIRLLFLSTLPAWGATTMQCGIRSSHFYFYPRSPRGERLRFSFKDALAKIFLSTLPAWGATFN